MHKMRSCTETRQNRSLHGFYFYAEGGYITFIELKWLHVDTFLKSQSMIFRFDHLDNVKLPHFIKFLVGSFYYLFTEFSKWVSLCLNEIFNMLKYEVSLVGDWYTKL